MTQSNDIVRSPKQEARKNLLGERKDRILALTPEEAKKELLETIEWFVDNDLPEKCNSLLVYAHNWKEDRGATIEQKRDAMVASEIKRIETAIEKRKMLGIDYSALQKDLNMLKAI